MQQPTERVANEEYTEVYGWISVPRGIVETVLEHGYTCKSRAHVPISFDPLFADRARRQHQSERESVSLEVHGLSEELLPSSDRKAGHFTNVKHLPPEFLRLGDIRTRMMSEYVNAPCPFCGDLIADKAEMRGQVGLTRTISGVFQVSPCTNSACQEDMKKRQWRLEAEKPWTLYHATTTHVAKEILRGGGKMIRGSGGQAEGDSISRIHRARRNGSVKSEVMTSLY